MGPGTSVQRLRTCRRQLVDGISFDARTGVADASPPTGGAAIADQRSAVIGNRATRIADRPRLYGVGLSRYLSQEALAADSRRGGGVSGVVDGQSRGRLRR